MLFTATARWNFRGETWLSVELEATSIELAGVMFYSILPMTFFRGKSRLVAIKPQGVNGFEPQKMLARGDNSSASEN